ncbi:MAG: hypothetical protein ACI892_002234, partial [Marinobacter maritimus]
MINTLKIHYDYSMTIEKSHPAAIIKKVITGLFYFKLRKWQM